MKQNAFILTLVAGFFIFQPGLMTPQRDKCSTDKCPMQQVCAGKKSCEQKRSKEGCTSNGCNPFMACWCGNFFVIEKTFASSAPIATIHREYVITNEKNVSGTAYECWHPPEMI